MPVNERYTRELKENLNYTATWLPNLKLALGDVGLLSKHEFIYRTNLDKLKIPFEASKRGAKASYSHTSSNAVTRDIKLAGQAPLLGSTLADADAGITFSFGGQQGIVFLASECTIRVIADQEPLKQAILDAFRSGRWERDYVVVTELVEAGATTIIVAQGTSGRYELKAKAGLVPTFDGMNVQGNFALVHDAEIGFHCLAERGMTPLFRCLGVRTGLFRDDVVTRDAIVRGADAATVSTPSKGEAIVDEVEYEDFA